MASTGITCVRCGRSRVPQQVVVDKTKGATVYSCADEKECDEYQASQRSSTEPNSLAR